MTTALEIITDAYERMNRLSPGETLSGDDAAFGLRRLNLMLDEFGTQGQMLYKSVITAAAQTGNITLGAGSWAAIAPGDQIVSVTVDGLPIDKLSMAQYHAIEDNIGTGSPSQYAYDGLSTIYFDPVPTGQGVRIMSLAGASTFADTTTEYTLPKGYKSMFGACLAVRLAPAILGKLPQELIRAEREARSGVSSYKPAILDVGSYAYSPRRSSILTG